MQFLTTNSVATHQNRSSWSSQLGFLSLESVIATSQVA